MDNISLHSNFLTDITFISNTFIDKYMACAGGEYVKIYLYLLRQCNNQSATDNLRVSAIADFFDHTERDIIKALKYWEKHKLISLQYDNNKNITSILMLNIIKREEEITPSCNEIIALDKPTYSPEQIEKLSSTAEVQEIYYIAQKYLGRTLSSTDVNTLLYFYEALNFSTDLIIYLLEYCVSRNQKGMRYIEKVAISWANQNIDTVDKAKESNSLYSSTYFSVLKAFGISNRNPVDSEKKYIDKWLNEYLFDMNIILEACDRTMKSIHKPSFEYTEAMLNKWHMGKVKHLSDINSLDDTFMKLNEKKVNIRTTPKANNVRNGNFPQREYTVNDYSDMERKFLNTGNIS